MSISSVSANHNDALRAPVPVCASLRPPCRHAILGIGVRARTRRFVRCALLTLQGKPLFVERNVRFFASAIVLVCLAGLVRAQENTPARLPTEFSLVRLHFFPQVYKSCRGDHATFFIRLPEHVRFREGSTLRVGLDVSAPITEQIVASRFFVNGQRVLEQQSALPAGI